MSVPIPLGLAQPDAINHARVVQGIAQDRVLFTEQCLEESGIRVEAGAIENRVLRIQEVRDGSLEFFVEVLGPANKSHGRHAVPVRADGLGRRFHDRRMVRQAKIVIRAQIDDRGGTHCSLVAMGRNPYRAALRAEQDTFVLVEAGFPDVIQLPVNERFDLLVSHD